MKQEAVLALQGGGALGAYECGVYKALEGKGIEIDIASGVSIGAINASIIASNKRGDAARVLENFWNEIAVTTPFLYHEGIRKAVAALQVFLFGVPRFFTPRWLIPSLDHILPFFWKNLYDTNPLRRTLKNYVDFTRLPSSETRLLLTAVNVETGELEIFDSCRDQITVDHIIASGSLSPGLLWTEIEGKYYWDGGIISNTPLRAVLERCSNGIDKRAYIVDLFPKAGHLPRNISEVLERYKDIMYSDKIERDIERCEVTNKTLKLISKLLNRVDKETAEKIKQTDVYKQIVKDSCMVHVTHIAHSCEEFEFHFKDYDFSRETIREHIELGYKETIKILEKETIKAE